MCKDLPISRFQLGLVIILLSFTLLFSFSAQATNRTDILIGLKILPMLSQPIPSPVVIGIIYDPNNPESKADANSVKAVLDAGVKAPDGTPVGGLLVPISEIGKLSQVRIAFVASGCEGSFDVVAQTAAAHGVLTMSADIQCVTQNKCVLGIVSQPVVEIYFSREADEASKISFDPAFTMLIKKV